MRPALLALAAVAACSNTTPADRVFTNAVIYTADSTNPERPRFRNEIMVISRNGTCSPE